jgi:SAM-dependent methyltransferase
MNLDYNLAKFNSPEVVLFYETKTELQPCEKHLFDSHLKRSMALLDMGVGGGRTTPYLSEIAGRYIGADYSEAMVEACRKRFPDLEFRHCDATDMHQFSDGAFDAVVFSFNGIDCIRNDEGRARCLTETSRVLKPGGIFIFSSHNARALPIWPLQGARGHQIPLRIVRSVLKSASIAQRILASGAYAAGEGYIRDPVHGGLDTYVSTPATIVPQLTRAGFEIIETVGGRFPTVRSAVLTPWYYYACRKIRRAAAREVLR